MTQHKVIAEDSLSAMDEISRVLGKDAVILDTKKIMATFPDIELVDVKEEGQE